MGQGWNLFGTSYAWRPIMAGALPYLQVALLLLGLTLAVNATYNIAMELFGDHGKAMRATLVMGALHTLAALAFIWIIAG
jgi:hypothetical protein